MAFRLGLIGAGGIAEQHAEAARAVGIEIAAVQDVDLDRATALAAASGGVTATDDLDALLARDDVDGVVIAIPNAFHKDAAIAALEAGKPVFLEKPMAMSVAECDAIADAVARTNGTLQLGFVSRFAPAVVALRERADDLGRIYLARVQYFRRRGIPGLGGWFTTRARAGGGVLIDLGVHAIDLVLELAGRPRPTHVSGACTSVFGAPIEDYVYDEMWAGPPRPDGAFDVEDGLAGFVRFEGGLTLDLGLSWAANLNEAEVPSGILVLGERGGCFLDPWSGRLSISTERDGALVDEAVDVPAGDSWTTAFRAEHAAFRDAVVNGTETHAPAAHGREVQVILDALYRSSAEGREVVLDER